MKIDSIDLKIIHAIENGGKFFLNAFPSVLSELNLKQEEIKNRLARIESENLIKKYKATILIPSFLGGDWVLACLLVDTSEPAAVIDQVIKKLPFVIEIFYNISIPKGIGPNLNILFYTKDFIASVQFLKEFSKIDYSEMHKLRDCSFPIPTPLTTNEKLILKEICLNPLISCEELTRLSSQDLTWIKEKINRLVVNPMYIQANSSPNTSVLQILPEIDWAACENFRHVHFVVDKPVDLTIMKNCDFEPVMSGKPFRDRFYQLETDLWGFDQLVNKIESLQNAGFNMKGLILADSNIVINHWVNKLLD